MSTIPDKFEQILDAAIESIAESGYHQCTVAKIATRAGVATGTIYLYFKNKEEVLIRVFQERMGVFTSGIRRKLQESDDTKTQLRTIISSHFEYMEQNRSLAIVTQIELRQSDPVVRKAISEPLRAYLDLIEEVIREGISRGEVTAPNVRVARQMIFGALEQATTDWVWADKNKKLSSEVEPLMFLLEGALRLRQVQLETNA